MFFVNLLPLPCHALFALKHSCRLWYNHVPDAVNIVQNSVYKCTRLAFLSWLHSRKCIDLDCDQAAECGNLALLQLSRDNGCPWDEWTCCMHAAAGGHLAVLQWARTNGCPWDTRTCANAAAGGHMHVLQWARANGCPEYF